MSKAKLAAGAVCSVAAIIGIITAQQSGIRTTQQGLEIIGNAEGCLRSPYVCPAGVLTVGIGSTAAGGEAIEPKKRYTDQEIAARWINDIKQAEACVNRYANGRKMPQGAFEAMTSLTFNVGCATIRHSTLFRMANEQGYKRAMCDQFERWIYAGGKKLNGLVNRRAKEKALCLQK